MTEADTARCEHMFRTHGPIVRGVPLLRKTLKGFETPNAASLGRLLDIHADVGRVHASLTGIERHLNDGNLALAAIATAHLVPLLRQRRQATDPLMKASPDDLDHPGWPEGAPDGKGGQFRPKTGSAQDSIVPPLLNAPQSDEATNLKQAIKNRLKNRRTFRSIARRVLTAKRVLRLLGKNVLAGLTEEIPVVDAVLTNEAITEDVALLRDIAADVKDSDAALAVVEGGPRDLSQLLSPKAPKDFETFDELKKIELARYISPAGDGEDIHHIVEQSQVGGDITNRMVQSTENVVKIPRILHEEINSIYATETQIGENFVSPRNYLRGKPYKEQYAYGLKVLRAVGLLR